jgi:hypothetical protein
MVVVFVKDQIETGDFISHAHFEYIVGEVSWEFLNGSYGHLEGGGGE